ncbi:MAG: DNA polymerase IV [Oscillospiraceae bacterium]
MERIILHCDCNGFFASVESVLCPALQEVPMAVCGDPKSRHGIILAKNELAKRYHIQTAETVWQALRKCPSLTLVEPHREAYTKYSRQINEIYERYTDLVEPFGIDESWLDVTGSAHLFGTGKQIADTLRRVVRQETGITISVGVSFNKVFAKLGSDYQKPDATTVITQENFRDFVWPLPVGAMLYVGPSAERTLAGMDVKTIGQLAQTGRRRLTQRLGKLGEQIYDYANGLDEGAVRSACEEREIKSVSNGMTFRRNLMNLQDVRIGLEALSGEVATRLRRHGVECRTVAVQIKDTRMRIISRQRALPCPTALAYEIAAAALELVQESWNMAEPIRMLTVTAVSLIGEGEEGEQLSFEGQLDAGYRERQEKLERTLDVLRSRFGADAVSTGAILGSDIGVSTKKSH